MLSAAALPAPDPEDQFSMFPNEALDRIGYLDPYELTTYAHLLRLTRGFHVASKRIGLERLGERTSIGRTKLKATIRSLENKGLVQVEETTGRTNLYSVVFPRELPDWETQTPLKEVSVDEPNEHQQNEESLTLVESHKTTPLSHDTTLLKETSEKDLDLKYTPEPPVCVDDGPIIPIKDIIDGAGFVSPLGSMTQGALDLAYRLAPAWTVLRVLITLLVGYLYKVDAIINPLALIKYALKSRDFVKLADKDIVTEFLKKLKYFSGHIPQNERKYFIPELNEIRSFEDWLEIHHEITLKDLYCEYHRQCQITSNKWSFLWFFIVTDPSKEKMKK